MKPGTQTTEFAIVVIFGFFVLLSGLSIQDGSVSYLLADDMKELLGWVVTSYVVGRSAVKVGETLKKPASDKPPSAEEVAKEVIKQITPEKGTPT